MSLAPVWTYAENVSGPEVYSPADPGDARRIEKLVNPARRQEILHARHLMRRLIAGAYERENASITLHAFDDDVPVVEGLEGLGVSWSRSGPHALAALLPAGRIGVDLEQVRPVDWKPMLKMIALAQEQAPFDGLQSDESALGSFYRLWCAKEALLKWRGTGLRGGAKTVSVPGDFITGDTNEMIVTSMDVPVCLRAVYPAEGLVGVLAFSD